MANAPEVQTYSGTPLEHYIIYGWRKGLNPSAEFNSDAWVASHPHLKNGNTSPLFDYVVSRQSVKRSEIALSNVGRVAVFGAISEKYDDLKDPEFEHDSVDYFMFTDQAVPEYSKWRKKEFEFISYDPTRTARFVKTHPHLYFGEYDWAIWIDSNLQINCDPRLLISTLDENTQIATWSHPLRSCAYDEASACISRGKDDEETINSLIAFLKAANFPHRAGLLETSVFVSRMGDPKVANFLNDWWALIDKFSRRDQLSLPYLLREHGLEVSRLAEPGVCMRTDPRFVYYRHQK